MEQNFAEFLGQFQKYHEQGLPLVIVTLLKVRGSVPQDVGARMLVGTQGRLFGTIGGGKLENKCLGLSAQMLSGELTERHAVFEWNLQKDVGMTCGGVATLFFEYQPAKTNWPIAIFGAGHVSQALTRVLTTLDCELTVIDTRPEWLEKLPEHPKLKKILSVELAQEVAKLDPQSFLISMTMGHAHDVPVLNQAFKHHAFPYMGVIGSDSKARILKHELRQLGVEESQLESLHCPIGEPIGSNAPAEIAISICAQLLKVRDLLRNEK